MADAGLVVNALVLVLGGQGFHTPAQPRRLARRFSLKIFHRKIFRALITPWDIWANMKGEILDKF